MSAQTARSALIVFSLFSLAGCVTSPTYSQLEISCFDTQDIAQHLDAGGDPNALVDLTDDPDRPETASLLACAAQTSPTLVETLIQRGAEVNLQDREGDTALLWVESPEIAKLLIAQGADVTLSGWRRPKPLHVAVVNSRFQLAEMYLQAGADANAAEIGGNTPLHLTSSAEMAALLLEYGAAPSPQNHSGATPLHLYYAYQDGMRAAEVLIQHGADVNAKDRYGATPLHGIACDRQFCDRSTAEAELLLSKGADANATNTAGESVLELAIAANRQDLVELLKRYGAN